MANGKVIGSLRRRHRASEFKKFLVLVDEEVPAHLDVHLVLDNYSTHKTLEIQRWLLRHPRFHLHLTATAGSWLNMVERWFAELTTNRIKRAPTPSGLPRGQTSDLHRHSGPPSSAGAGEGRRRRRR